MAITFNTSLFITTKANFPNIIIYKQISFNHLNSFTTTIALTYQSIIPPGVPLPPGSLSSGKEGFALSFPFNNPGGVLTPG